MKPALALAAALGLAIAPTSSGKEVGATRPPVALSVSPARIALTAPGSRAVRLRNVGARDVVVETQRKPVGTRGPAHRWVTIAPGHLVLPSGQSAALTLRVTPQPGAGPGDHHVLVLLVARPAVATSVAVRMRLGVVVRFRVAGRIVRSIRLGSLRVLRRGSGRLLALGVANAGNVSEDLRRRMTIVLIRGRRPFARLRTVAPRELRPGAHAVLRARYAGTVRGHVKAVVTGKAGGGSRSVRRIYSIRL